MKKLSKILSVALALVLTMSLSFTAFAAEPSVNPLAVETNGTLTVTGKQLKDKTVTIARMFSTDVTSSPDGAKLYGYTLEDAWQGFFNEQLSKLPGQNATSQEAYEYVSNLDRTQLITFVKAAETYYQAHSTEFAAVTNTAAASAVQPADDKNPQAGKAEFRCLTSGYYLVMPDYVTTELGTTRGTHAMLVNVSDDNTVNMVLKTDEPTVDKEIVKDDSTTNSGSAQIGDDVNFQLTAAVPNMTDYDTYTFKFKDTLSKGLTLKQESIKVTVGTTVLNLTDDYTVDLAENPASGDGSHILTIDFKDLKALAAAKGFHAGDVVKIEYTATLNKDAQTGTNPNTNKAELEYSNDPSNGGTGTSNPSTTDTYTFEIKIHKYADNDLQHQLAGAEFQLQNAQGEVIKLVKETETDYRVATQEEITAAASDLVDHIVTVADKDVVIKGLKEGEYKLVETKAPAGYNKLSNPIELKIVAQYELDGTLMANYPQVWFKNDRGEYAKPEAATGSILDDTQIMVQNKSGAFLPETGSIGTIGLTAVGVALVVGGLGFTSRKKKEQN